MLMRGFGARRGPGLIRGVARTAVVAGTATAVSGAVRRHQANRDMEAYAEAAQQVAPPPPGGGGITPEQIDRLKQLAELKQAGVLTEVEFEVQKAQILGH